jgi:pimeloyl-ACP methyl ester carboxylesterase
VESLVLSSSLCSTRFWVEETRRLRDALPAYVVATMRRFEDHHDATAAAAKAAAASSGTTRPGIPPEQVARPARLMQRAMPLLASPFVQRLASWGSRVPPFRRAAYEIAGMAFLRRHLCRAPMSLALCQDYLARNQQVYETLWGPSEFFATGVLADWTVEPRLGEIDVPTLILSGRHDEATPAHMRRLLDGIRGSQWTILEHSAHLTFFEETDRYCEILSAFLERVEAGPAMTRGDRE